MNYFFNVAGAVLGILCLALFFRRRGIEAEVLNLRTRIKELEEERHRAKFAPRDWECRIERFDVLWFCALRVSPASREVVSCIAGVPHCKTCVVPLKLERDDWVCPQCATRRPESVGDVLVMDAVARQAADNFLQKHKDYRLAGSRVGGKSSLM